MRGLGAMIAIELFENGDPRQTERDSDRRHLWPHARERVNSALLRSPLLQHLAHPRSTHCEEASQIRQARRLSPSVTLMRRNKRNPNKQRQVAT
ncbi:hypothetical protein KCP74_11505 [Salmonella enterica subsp. enterica]|nr:hypothetical protein KCP74_11505 [Salmonella enterica subsp. enterica]